MSVLSRTIPSQAVLPSHIYTFIRGRRARERVSLQRMGRLRQFCQQSESEMLSAVSCKALTQELQAGVDMGNVNHHAR